MALDRSRVVRYVWDVRDVFWLMCKTVTRVSGRCALYGGKFWRAFMAVIRVERYGEKGKAVRG